MRFLSTKIHGVLDYLTAIVFITMPWIMQIRKDGPVAMIFICLGIFILLYSAFTKYECALFRKIYMPLHLMLDAIIGIFLAASPWLFDFAHESPLIFICAGIFCLLVSLITRKKAADLPFKRNVYHQTIVY